MFGVFVVSSLSVCLYCCCFGGAVFYSGLGLYGRALCVFCFVLPCLLYFWMRAWFLGLGVLYCLFVGILNFVCLFCVLVVHRHVLVFD